MRQLLLQETIRRETEEANKQYPHKIKSILHPRIHAFPLDRCHCLPLPNFLLVPDPYFTRLLHIFLISGNCILRRILSSSNCLSKPKSAVIRSIVVLLSSLREEYSLLMLLPWLLEVYRRRVPSDARMPFEPVWSCWCGCWLNLRSLADWQGWQLRQLHRQEGLDALM